MSLKKRLVINSIFAALPRILGWSLTIFITPYIVHQLGIARFGTWTLLSSLSSYLFLLDFGFASAIARFVAEADAVRDDNRLSKIFSISVFLYVAAGGAIATVLLVWQDEICNFLRLETADPFELKGAYTATVFSFLFSMFATAYLQIIDGLQKMNISGTITSLAIISTNVLSVIIVYLGHGILGLAVVSLCISSVMFVSSLVAVRKSIPSLKFSRFEWALFRSMLKYGSQLQVSSLLYVVVIRTESPIISSMLGTVAVGYYRLANGLAGLSRDIPSLLLSALIPTATMLHASERKAELQHLYTQANTYLTFCAISIAGFFFCFAESLLRMWLNSDEFLQAALPMRLMIIGFCANILTGVCTSLARAIGQAKQEMLINLAISVMHILLNIGLLYQVGMNAIGLATALVLVPMSALLIGQLSRYFGASLLIFWKQNLLPNLLLVALSLFIARTVYELLRPLLHQAISTIRLFEFVALLIAGSIFLTIQVLLGAHFGIVQIDDLQLLQKRKVS